MRRVLLLVFLASFAFPVAAQRCDTALDEADEQYRAGYFDDVIERLSDCLDQNAFSAGERRRAYRLLGLSYIGKDREAEARNAVRSLLEVAPDYQPDPALDPPPFVELVREMNQSNTPPGEPARPIADARPVSVTRGFMGSLTATGAGYADSDDDSANGAGAYLTLGYGVTPAIAVTFQLGGASFSEFGDGIGEATIGSVGLGGRYHFGGGRSKLVPFLGGGASFQSLSIDFDPALGGGSDEYSGAGGTLEAGLLYFLSPAFAIDGGAQAFFNSLTSDLADRTITATTIHFGVGVSWSPSR